MASTTTTSTSFHPFSSTFTPPRSSHAPPSSASFRHTLPTISASGTRRSSITLTSSTATTSSFYEILGIQTGATCKEIKAAYWKLARIVHPDVAGSNGQKEATSDSYEFIKVHEAYATLSDPHKRADYDRMLLMKRRRIGYSPNYAVSTAKYPTASSSGFSGHARRTWETDQCW